MHTATSSSLPASPERRSARPSRPGIANVEVELRGDDGDYASVSWDFGGFSHHFWTTLPALEPSPSRSMAGTIYKNLPADAGEAEKRAFRPSYLNADSVNGRRFLDEVRAIVARHGLIAKAYAARTARLAREAAEAEAEEIAEAKRRAAVELYAALLFARGFLDPSGEAHRRAGVALAEAERRPVQGDGEAEP